MYFKKKVYDLGKKQQNRKRYIWMNYQLMSFDRTQLKSKHYIFEASLDVKETKYHDFSQNPKEFLFHNEQFKYSFPVKKKTNKKKVKLENVIDFQPDLHNVNLDVI